MSVNLSSLTELRALEVRARTAATVELGEKCCRLKWLHIFGRVEVHGDVSQVTHLLLAGWGPTCDTLGRYLILKQLSLTGIPSKTSIVIPASVDRLFIHHGTLRELVLPEEKVLEVLSLYDVCCDLIPKPIRAMHLRLGFCENKMSGIPVLGSPKSLSVECSKGCATSDLLESILEKDDFRRDIQFFATNIRLEKPLPPMPELCELSLERFADVQHFRELAKVNPIRKLFVAGNDYPAFEDWEALQLQEICKSAIVPPGLKRVLGNHGLQVREWNGLSPWCLSAAFVWADYVRRSSGEFDVHCNILDANNF